MKTTRKTDPTAAGKCRASFCLCGARTLLKYLHASMAETADARQQEFFMLLAYPITRKD